jgi:hypothetical protein
MHHDVAAASERADDWEHERTAPRHLQGLRRNLISGQSQT